MNQPKFETFRLLCFSTASNLRNIIKAKDDMSLLRAQALHLDVYDIIVDLFGIEKARELHEEVKQQIGIAYCPSYLLES